jgi:hypothetical protein
MTDRFLVPCAAIALFLFGWPTQVVPQNPKTLALQIRSESWVPDSGFPREEFTRLCAAAQLTLVRDSGPDGRIVIEYVEAKGSRYTSNPFTFFYWGTTITYKLRLLSPADGKPLIALATSARTPAWVSYSVLTGPHLHQLAVEDFKSRPQYRLACTMIAAVLGSRTEAEKLLPWAVSGKEYLQLLEKAKYVPSTPRDRAFLAVAKRDWGGLSVLGDAAAEPLRLFIQSDSGVLAYAPSSFTGAQDLADVAAAATALAATSDPGAARTLEGLLSRCWRWRLDTATPLVVPTLRALGRVGDASSLSVIAEWTRRSTGEGTEGWQAAKEIAMAAEQGAASIRARLAAK